MATARPICWATLTGLALDVTNAGVGIKSVAKLT